MIAPFVGQNAQVFSQNDAINYYNSHIFSTNRVSHKLTGGVVSLTVVLNDPMTPVLVTGAT